MHIYFRCEYLGTNYAGFQRQQNAKTIQGELENALEKFFGERVAIVGSGRTDAGVHARGQVCSFVCPKVFDKRNEDKFLYKVMSAMNAFLSADISVCDFKTAESFNARQMAKTKTYIYRVYVGSARSALRDETHHHIYKLENFDDILDCAKLFVGTHDFTSFCTELADKTPTRTIYALDITLAGDELIFTVKGNGFLRNMVRIIVGTLLGVSEGKFKRADIEKMFLARDRKTAGETAPAKGLTLDKVEY
ncbi:MAG: tRNA pseudouridine(38-40) synthase TruA [Christensenellaceae bacterium]|jgi:tRNA pseudouridine38-40 synthase|nr:tRNA pseudouridine(38-40) synthase TruA [Christensenellaceae bacterium]